jgi:hypothetical protein
MVWRDLFSLSSPRTSLYSLLQRELKKKIKNSGLSVSRKSQIALVTLKVRRCVKMNGQQEASKIEKGDASPATPHMHVYAMVLVSFLGSFSPAEINSWRQMGRKSSLVVYGYWRGILAQPIIVEHHVSSRPAFSGNSNCLEHQR